VSRPAMVGLALSFAACEGVLPEPDLERMQEQPSHRPYEFSAHFADHRSMRTPPAGTVRHDAVLGKPGLTTGIEGDAYVDRVPIPVDRALLARGRDRFDAFCGVCHGLTGDGSSAVAASMALRRPPSLVDAPTTRFPPGRVFQVISVGYGLMPSYAAELAVHDRWSVVAYLGALQLSHGARLSELPIDVRAEAAQHLERP
jgi:mono/diheme cytochrome c family protein